MYFLLFGIKKNHTFAKKIKEWIIQIKQLEKL